MKLVVFSVNISNVKKKNSWLCVYNVCLLTLKEIAISDQGVCKIGAQNRNLFLKWLTIDEGLYKNMDIYMDKWLKLYVRPKARYMEYILIIPERF